ncbi:LAME_0E11738g1_1 [Lachancea meyersii CBS 8951]|uniref:LAME_0E11738g1_1 n=1 Tax=Lachancea meyersii CBS 8951 TaxID=1266667 RepID=A0A1G4JL68_9SACH|nr:LAME_0E11738g1_1 [Lachancea meyersii CBS 8951]
MSQNTTITLKTLTAHELLSARENVCELFGLIDNSERRTLLVGDNREAQLEALKLKLEDLKRQVEEAKTNEGV